MTEPKISVPQVPEGEHAAVYLNNLSNPDAVAAYLDFFIATLDVPPNDTPDDAQTVELVRIRNAVTQACEY